MSNKPTAERVPPLTIQQLGSLRARLEEERRRIMDVLKTAPDLPGASLDEEQSEFEEFAQRTAERTDELGVSRRERALLAEVDHALSKLQVGTYGVDEETGEAISYERLMAVPWARCGIDSP